MFKKIVSVLFLLAITLFTGCNNKESNDKKVEKNDVSKVKKLSILLESYNSKGIDNVIKAYEKKNPNVKIDMIIATDTSNLDTIMTAKLSSHDIPDMIITQVNSSIQSYARGGYTLPYDGFNLKDKIIDGDHSLLKSDGKYYAIPLQLSTSGLYINNSVLKKFNVSLKPVPQTLDELISFCQKLKDAGIDSPFTIGGKETSPATAFVFQYIYQNVYGNNQNWYSDVLKGKEAWNSDSFKATFKAYEKLKPFINKNVLGLDASGSQKRFLTGQSAIYIDTSNAISRFRSIDPNMDLTLIPSPFANDKKDMKVIVNFDSGLQISKDSKNKDICKDFASFILKPENYKLYGSTTGGLSPLKGISISADPALTYISDVIAKGAPTTPMLSREWIPGIKEILKKGSQNWLAGESIDKVCNTIENEHQRLMKANPEYIKSFLDSKENK